MQRFTRSVRPDYQGRPVARRPEGEGAMPNVADKERPRPSEPDPVAVVKRF